MVPVAPLGREAVTGLAGPRGKRWFRHRGGARGRLLRFAHHDTRRPGGKRDADWVISNYVDLDPRPGLLD